MVKKKRPANSFSLSARRFYSIVARIPRGKTMTYGEVAQYAGNPGAARAVGTILSKNHNPAIPCHRVIRADGTPGGYNRGAALKEQILRREKACGRKNSH